MDTTSYRDASKKPIYHLCHLRIGPDLSDEFVDHDVFVGVGDADESAESAHGAPLQLVLLLVF